MQLPWHDYVQEGGTATTLVILASIYRKVSVMAYQHKLIWAWFKREHGIDRENGER